MKVFIQLCIICLLVVAVPVFAGDSPTEDLKPTLTSLVNLLADESLKGHDKKNERRMKIMDEIKKGFDFREMSKRVLGKTWNSIDDPE